jgi:hypothetical protein
VKFDVIEGQINLFDLPIQENIKPKEPVAKCEPKENSFKEIINLYKESCNRIVKTVSGALMVELDDKTMYFNQNCENEFNLGTNIGLIPADEIILVNKDKELNDVQLKKLKEINPEKYIKRKGEANIIIPTNSKTITITNRGWVLEWNMKPVYKEDEVFTFKNTLEKNQDNEELNIGDKVEFEYEGQSCKGRIVSVYNSGLTVNVVWNHKHTAFYYKCVKKVA